MTVTVSRVFRNFRLKMELNGHFFNSALDFVFFSIIRFRYVYEDDASFSFSSSFSLFLFSFPIKKKKKKSELLEGRNSFTI